MPLFSKQELSMCSYFSMLENKIMIIASIEFLSFYFLALRYVKVFPAGAVRPVHRMPNAFLAG